MTYNACHFILKHLNDAVEDLYSDVNYECEFTSRKIWICIILAQCRLMRDQNACNFPNGTEHSLDGRFPKEINENSPARNDAILIKLRIGIKR